MKLKFAILLLFFYCCASCGGGLEQPEPFTSNDAYINGEIKKFPYDVYVIKEPESRFEEDQLCWLGDVNLCLDFCLELKRYQMSLGFPPTEAHWCDVFLANYDR
tara:strand:+ start:981 stop:1292 length:312 start_codon:yes stop_codon:yes gene_type:complete